MTGPVPLDALAVLSDDALVQILHELRPQLEAYPALFAQRKAVWMELRARGWTFAAMGEPAGVSEQMPRRHFAQSKG